MSLRKNLESIEKEYHLFNTFSNIVISKLDGLSDKFEGSKSSMLKKRIVATRNWINTLLLCIIIVLLLSSCFVSGRSIHVITPRVDLQADTATAYSWPYNTKFQ